MQAYIQSGGHTINICFHNCINGSYFIDVALEKYVKSVTVMVSQSQYLKLFLHKVKSLLLLMRT